MTAPCDRRTAQNAIKALAFVDRHQVAAFANDCPPLGDGLNGFARWTFFTHNSAAYFARTSDEIADAIWAAAFPETRAEPETFTGPSP